MKPSLIKIGLSGGIGSGKSTVSQMLVKQPNVIHIDADKVYHELLNRESKLQSQLMDAFGPSIMVNDEIQRNRLAQKVLGSDENMATLNRISHPIILTEIEKMITAAQTVEDDLELPLLCVIEAALLIESGFHKQMDYVVVVSAPLNIRLARVKKRDNLEEEEIRMRMAHQLSDQTRKIHADYIINNPSSTLLLQQQVKHLDKLMRRSF